MPESKIKLDKTTTPDVAFNKIKAILSCRTVEDVFPNSSKATSGLVLPMPTGRQALGF
jgi:hypothetical protein